MLILINAAASPAARPGTAVSRRYRDTMDQPGGPNMPPSGQTPPPPPPAAPPPPPQNWQSTPQPPGPPPMGGGQPGGAPSWSGNITASNTITGPAGLALASLPDR